jgi:hypothetical protein
MMSLSGCVLLLLHFATMAQSQNDSYPQDPILSYRPPFVQSLPVQVLVTGIALTLAAVLLLHLVFTAQYHWPLARTNYVLQLTGVTTLIISISATIYVVFSATIRQSQHWPYMLNYLAVEMPAANYTVLNSTDPTLIYQHLWSTSERATWVVMNATTSVVVQVRPPSPPLRDLTPCRSHTSTFSPSSFPLISRPGSSLVFSVRRPVFAHLSPPHISNPGPLAIISATMQLLPLIYGSTVATFAADTRNVCNAALSLLFTSFLIIWGFFVNRRQAWRTDGGTAAFGAGAIILAIISTVLNFLYIPKQDQYTWMPRLMWAVTLWQSFLGWWWWVGAGMGVREVEELLLRENKRQQKRLLRAQRRKEQREKAKSVWKGVTGAFKPNTKPDASPSDPLRAPSQDGSSVSGLASSAWMHPVQMVQRWFASLRHAHLAAAHVQAAERAERLHQVYQREEERNPDGEYRKPVVGWGLGSFGIREAERERREEIEMETRIPHEEEEEEEEWKDVPLAQDPVPEGLRYRGPDPLPPVEESAGSSLWWWGPLRRWRLKDSTTYR